MHAHVRARDRSGKRHHLFSCSPECVRSFVRPSFPPSLTFGCCCRAQNWTRAARIRHSSVASLARVHLRRSEDALNISSFPLFTCSSSRPTGYTRNCETKLTARELWGGGKGEEERERAVNAQCISTRVRFLQREMTFLFVLARSFDAGKLVALS